MHKHTNILLTQIVDQKTREFSLKKIKWENTGSIISIFREEWHLFALLEHPCVSTLEIQCSICIEGDFVRTVWFPDPTLITPKTKTEFVLLANEANIELHSGGRFWCNEDMDFAYEIVLSEEMIEKCEYEVARLLFDIPYSNFCDLHAPLEMLKQGTWQANTAIKYLKELRTQGVVDNSNYDLW